MKSLFLICGLLAMLLTSCSGGGDKFVGNWTNTGNAQVPKNYFSWQFNIEKVDSKTYHLRFLKYDQNDTVKMEYDKDADILKGFIRSGDEKLIYLKDKDHLLMSPLGIPGKYDKILEFERIKDK